MDFASTDRPRKGTRPMSTHRFQKMLYNIHLKDIQDIERIFEDCKSEEERREKYSELIKEYLPPLLTIVFLKKEFYEFIQTSHHHYDKVVYPKERMRDFSRPGYSHTSRPTTPEELKAHLGDSVDIKIENYNYIYPFCYWKLLELQVHSVGNYFSVDQVIEILLYFPQVNILCPRKFSQRSFSLFHFLAIALTSL